MASVLFTPSLEQQQATTRALGRQLHGPPPRYQGTIKAFEKVRATGREYEGGTWYTQPDADLLMRIMEARFELKKGKMTGKMFREFMVRPETDGSSPLQKLNVLDKKAIDPRNFTPMRTKNTSAVTNGVQSRPYVPVPSFSSNLLLRPVNIEIVRLKYQRRARGKNANIHHMVLPLLGAKHMALLGVTRDREERISSKTGTKGKWRGVNKISYGRYYYFQQVGGSMGGNLRLPNREGIVRIAGPDASTYGTYKTPNISPETGRPSHYGVTFNTKSRIMQAVAKNLVGTLQGRTIVLPAGFSYELNPNYDPSKNQGIAQTQPRFKFDYGDNSQAIGSLLRVKDNGATKSLYFMKPDKKTTAKGVGKMRSTAKYIAAVQLGEEIARDKPRLAISTGNVALGQGQSSEFSVEEGEYVGEIEEF
jgi:hypothetical protein